MPLTLNFIIGRAGSGKTTRIRNAIADLCRRDPLGPPVYLIVPEQATFLYQRICGTSLGLAGTARVRVVSFRSLADDILGEAGGISIPEVSPLGRQIVLGHLLRKHQDELEYFRNSARRFGLAAELEATFADLDHAHAETDQLSKLMESLGDAPLAAKLRDILMLEAAFRSHVGNEHFDPRRRTQLVLDRMGHAPSLKNANVFVDAFYDFNPRERAMLCGLSTHVARLDVAVCGPANHPSVINPHQLPDEHDLFHDSIRGYQRVRLELEHNAKCVAEIEAMQPQRRFTQRGLRHVEEQWVEPSGGKAPASDAVVFSQADDAQGEVDAAARHILDLVAAGARLRDIVVLVRSLPTHHTLIEQSFTEHNIAFFSDRRRSAAYHPLVRLVRDLLQIRVSRFANDVMISLAKNPLVLSDSREADLLENYVLEHRIRGNGWVEDKAWDYQLQMLRREEDEARFNASDVELIRQKLMAAAGPMLQAMSGETVPLTSVMRAIYDCIIKLDVPAKLTRWSNELLQAGKVEESQEHQQVWNALMELLQEMASLLGDEAMSLLEIAEVLDAGLDRFTLALAPPTLDQLLVGDVERTRTYEAKHVLVLGLNQGLFPPRPTSQVVITDSDRELLRENKLELPRESMQEMLREPFYAYIAFSLASDSLWLSCHRAKDDTTPAEPSQFWKSLVARFESQDIRQIGCGGCAAEIGTPRQLMSRLVQWAEHRLPAPETDAAAMAAVFDSLCCGPNPGERLGEAKHGLSAGLSYRNAAQLSREANALLHASPLRASVSRIESFAACPYQHFARHSLKLRDRDDGELSTLDLGQVFHRSLETLIRMHLDESLPLFEERAPDQSTMDEIVETVGKSLRREIMLSSARSTHLLRHIGSQVGHIVRHQRVSKRQSQFEPVKLELAFDDDAELKPLMLTTPKGRELKLVGRLDRVDFAEIDDGIAAMVIDYKYRRDSLSLGSVYHGLTLQLLTYLLLLEANGEQITGAPLTPAAALYVKLTREMTRAARKDSPMPHDEQFSLWHHSKGLIDHAYALDLDRSLEAGGRAKAISIGVSKKDGTPHSNTSNIASADFAAVLTFVRDKIEKITDTLMDGVIAVSPYLLGTTTPCTNCEFKSLCRFEPKMRFNHFRVLTPMSAPEAIKLMGNGGEE